MHLRTNIHDKVVIQIDMLEPRRLASTVHPLITIGSLGDSYSDEYHFYAPDRSKAAGWVEQLVNNKRVSFGKASAKSRGTPRNQGYANDWALSGATSADLPIQTAGLAQEAAAGQIQFATILIGGNDFLNTLENISDPTTAQAVLTTTAQTVITNTENAVNTLLAASPTLKIVISNLPPVSGLPIVKEFSTDAESQAVVQLADTAEQQVNSALAAFAVAKPRLAIADFATAAEGFATEASFKIGNVKITTGKAGDNPHDLFLADGLHLGTIGSALLANVFVNTIDNSFGANIAPLTNRQILHDAGLV